MAKPEVRRLDSPYPNEEFLKEYYSSPSLHGTGSLAPAGIQEGDQVSFVTSHCRIGRVIRSFGKKVVVKAFSVMS